MSESRSNRSQAIGLALSLMCSTLSMAIPYTSEAAPGTPLSPEFKLANLPYTTPSAAVAHDSSGNILVLWSQSTADISAPIAFAKYSTTGATLIPPTELAGTSGQRPLQGSASMNADGNFVLTFDCSTISATGQPTQKICLQVFGPTGTASSGVVQIAELPPYGTDNTTYSSFYGMKTAMSASGSIVVAWSEWITKGSTTGGPYSLAIINRVYTRRYNLDGTAQGDAVTVASQTTPLHIGSHGTPVTGLAMNSKGAYAVSWEAVGYAFKTQFFNASGKASSAVISLPAPLRPAYKNVDSVLVRDTLAVTPSGDVVVAWTIIDNTVDPTSDTVYIGRYTARGLQKHAPQRVLTRRVLASFGLNDYGSGGLSIQATTDNGFWLNWGEFVTTDPANATLDISAQVYSANDQAIAEPFKIGSTTYDFTTRDTYPKPLVLSSVDNANNLFAVWGSISARLFEGP